MPATGSSWLAVRGARRPIMITLAPIAIVAGEVAKTDALAATIAEAVTTACGFEVAIGPNVAVAVVIARARRTFDVFRSAGIARHDSLRALRHTYQRLSCMCHGARTRDALARITHGHSTGTIDFN